MNNIFVTLSRIKDTGRIIIGAGYSTKSGDDALFVSMGIIKEPHVTTVINLLEGDYANTFPQALAKLGVPDRDLEEVSQKIGLQFMKVFGENNAFRS